jgi:hypothetical protein
MLLDLKRRVRNPLHSAVEYRALASLLNILPESSAPYLAQSRSPLFTADGDFTFRGVTVVFVRQPPCCFIFMSLSGSVSDAHSRSWLPFSG